MQGAAATTLERRNTRPRLAADISSSAALVAFVSPGQPGRTAANSYDVASVPPVAGDDPVNESDPTGLAVDLLGAADWAWDNVYGGGNDGWWIFGYGDDCTDFVSRALHEGGGDPEYAPTGFPAGNNSDDHYWYRYGYAKSGPIISYSASWGASEHLAHHFELNGSQFVVRDLAIKPWGSSCQDTSPISNEVQIGDVAFLNLNGATFSGIDHTGIVVAVNGGGGDMLIAQHSPGAFYTLSRWASDVPDAHIWIVRPNQK